MNIGALTATLGVDSRGLMQAEQDLRRFEKQAEDSVTRINRNLDRMGTQMKSVGKKMSMYMTLPLVGFGALVLRTAGNFQKEMNRVAAISQATGQELQGLEDLARHLGATTVYSASQAADAMSFLAMAGFEVEQVMSALPATLNLAAAGQMEMARAADIVSNVMQGFAIQADETDRVVDIMSKAFTTANTNLEELGQAMSYAAPVAKAYGIEIEEATAAVGFLSDAGVKGTRAGTSLRMALLQLADKSKELGLNIYDTEGNMKSLVGIIEEVERSGLSTTRMIEELGARAGPGMAILLDRGSDALRQYTEELRDSGGTAQLVADKQMEGLNGALKELRSAFEELQLAIADSGLLDFATDLAQKVTAVVRRISEWNEHTLKIITIIAALAAALGPLLFTLGFLASNVLPGLIRMTVGSARALNVLRIAMMKNPATLLAVGIAALVYQIYRMSRAARESSRDMQDMGAEFDSLIEKSRSFQDEYERIQDVMGRSADLSKQQTEKIITDIEQQIERHLDLQTELRGRIERIWREMADPAAYRRAYQDYMEALSVYGAWSEVTREALEEFERQEEIAERAGEAVESFHQELGKSEQRLEYYRDALRDATNQLQYFEEATEEAIVDPTSEIRKALQEQIRYIEKLAGAFDEFDVIGAKASAYQKAIEEALKMPEVSVEHIRDLIEEFAKINKEIEQFEIGKTLEKELTEAAIVYEAHGDELGRIRDSIRAYEDALEAAIMMHDTEKIQLFRAVLEGLRETLEGVNKQLTVEAAWQSFDAQMEQARLTLQLTGDELVYQESKLAALQQLYQILGQEAHHSQHLVKELWENTRAEIDETTDALRRYEQKMMQIRRIQEQFVNELVRGLELIGTQLATGEADWASYGRQVLRTIQNIIYGLLVEAIMSMVAAESKAGVLGLITAAIGIAGILAIYDQYKVPSAASGALAYGETLVRVGDYPGASGNPEVISPLSDLKYMLEDTGSGTPAYIELRAKGDELYGVWNREHQKRQQLS